MTKETIVAGIRAALEDLNINFELKENDGVFIFGHGIHSKISTTRVFIFARNSDYLIKAVAPINADSSDDKVMLELAKLIVKINYKLIQGCFDMDFSDGELNFRIGVECTDLDRIPVDFVNITVALAIKSWNDYGDCFAGVIFGGLSADEALKLAKD